MAGRRCPRLRSTIDSAPDPRIELFWQIDAKRPVLSVNAIWSYEHPYSAVGQIEACMAFHPGRLDSIALEA